MKEPTNKVEKNTVAVVCFNPHCEKKMVGAVQQKSVGKSVGFPIQESHVQNHWVAPRSTQPFILPRSIKWVPGISGNLVVKSKLPPQSGTSPEAVEPHPWKGAMKRGHKVCLFFFYPCSIALWSICNWEMCQPWRWIRNGNTCNFLFYGPEKIIKLAKDEITKIEENLKETVKQCLK